MRCGFLQPASKRYPVTTVLLLLLFLAVLFASSSVFVYGQACEVRNDDIQQQQHHQQQQQQPASSRQTNSQSQQQAQQQKTSQYQQHDRGGGGGGGGGGGAGMAPVAGGSKSGASPTPAGHRGDPVGSPVNTISASSDSSTAPKHQHPPNRMLETRNSYAVLSQAMSQAVHHEFGTYGSGADGFGSCAVDDLDCIAHHDHLGLQAIQSLHRQLDDDDNGNIDLSESDDFLREELKYDSGYEKRHRAFHFNDDMHISVKELWEAWLRSAVHNWTVEQTTEWLAQSVQLPQYVHLFKQHKVTGKVLPRLAVNNMHYVSNVLGIKDPIHKQKIALKAMDAVLFGPPRETGTRWKDLLLVTLLLSFIIGSWWAYHQKKVFNMKMKRMARDVNSLTKAESAMKDMQKELEKARLEQENVGKEKMDLERQLREAPSLSSSSSNLEMQQLKQEIEMLRNELSRAEVEINDHCWTPPQGLQSWLQLTFELENKHHTRKRLMAEKQLMSAREACEKLKKKRTSLVGAFVSTHGRSIDDVDRSIVEARNSLNDVTNDLQERMYRWKQIEQLVGFSVVNNNGLSYLENLLYSRNGSGSKSYRSRLSSSQDDLDDDSVQGLYDGMCRGARDDSSASDDGDRDRETVTFIMGGCPTTTSGLQISALNTLNTGIVSPATASAYLSNNYPHHPVVSPPTSLQYFHGSNSSNSLNHSSSISSTTPSTPLSSPLSYGSSSPGLSKTMNDSSQSLHDETLISSSNERNAPPRSKKAPPAKPQPSTIGGKAPMPPPRKTLSSQSLFSLAHSGHSELVPLESPSLSLPAGAKIVSTSPTGAPGLISSASALQLQQLLDSGSARHQQSQSSRSLSSRQSSPGEGSVSSSSANVAIGGHELAQSHQQAAAAAPVPATLASSASAGGLSLGSDPGSTGGGTSTPGGTDHDTYSTDSSTIDEDVKRRRRKLHFPFGKRFSKSKKTQ